MILSVAGIFWILKSGVGGSFAEILREAGEEGMTKIYEGDWKSKVFFWKQIAGIFSTVAFKAGSVAALLFVLGLVASGYSSADGTIASLTTIFCVDILEFESKKTSLTEEKKTWIRKIVHIAFVLCFFLIIVFFRPFHSDSLIATIFTIAGYTYGPLLALFFFGMLCKRRCVNDGVVPYIAVLSPVISFFINRFSKTLFFGYSFGFEILLLNALLSFVALWIFSRRVPQDFISRKTSIQGVRNLMRKSFYLLAFFSPSSTFFL